MTRVSKPSSELPHADTPSLAGVTRRTFLKTLGTSAVTTAALGAQGVAKGLAQANAEQPRGPGAVAVVLIVNGEKKNFVIEPRTTLLEALRGNAGLTGAKEACDRATCGACTVLLNDTPVYACSMLAIEAQGSEITTIEGIARDGKLTALQRAMVDKDGLQCGYCSPGMVMVLTALLRKNPHPTETQARRAIAGNLCRCGSYPRIFAATLAASGQKPVAKLTVIPGRGIMPATRDAIA
jgi:aerobic-type carbon monoxide dehydrogenase small subunit (CoxS/CutS family)